MKLCVDCNYHTKGPRGLFTRLGFEDVCQRRPSPVTGEPLQQSCEYERVYGDCGGEGKHWRAKAYAKA